MQQRVIIRIEPRRLTWKEWLDSRPGHLAPGKRFPV